MAALLGLRIADKVSCVLERLLSQHTFWSDSIDEVHWVHGQSRKYKPFVAHRVAEILRVKHTHRSGTTCQAKSTQQTKPPAASGDRILRVGGSLQRSSLPYDAKHPLLVPCRNHIATLIVRHYHIKVGWHSKGVNAVLSETRQRYWIVHDREEVKRVHYDCRLCRRQRKKVAEQIMAPLPSHRITVPVRAFAKSGVDYAGPFYTKLTRRVIAKRYLCLFTCTTSRTVHSELAYSMDTDSFLNAFSRMVARCGKPAAGRSYLG
ncbi:uncharacterized protein [Ptychodera flava]|uniref:uncharacterized protein n=1 Tax=Ptychodera flava TaxID=63121 RepID=UPI00396A9BB0